MRTINFRSLFNYNNIKVDCIYCEKTHTDYTGWTGLCNRSCYYGICDLLDKYNNGNIIEPDSKIVKYFTMYPEVGHLFCNEKILLYIKNK
jgi:hypothetical protein